MNLLSITSKVRISWLIRSCLVVTCVSPTLAQDAQKLATLPWWGGQVNAALAASGERAVEWKAALLNVPLERRAGMEFLLANMPADDLNNLPTNVLLENLELAYQAREQVTWGKSIPEAIFLNDVLPYCHIDEPRDPWRREFYDRFIELARSCNSPSEVAQKLNETAFGKLEVKYSTERKRANQSPQESMDQGLASCTGLSIILADACRAVCVPARLVGIGKWPKKDGNHTWIEVWDDGWHFTGAAEPSQDGLNHAWFQADAATAVAESPMSSILAVSYQKTDWHWPLVWALDSKQVSAVNVTDRYTSGRDAVAKADTHRSLINVRDESTGERITATVSVVQESDATRSWTGTSRDESVDTNDILAFDLPKNERFRVVCRRRLREQIASLSSENPDKLLTVHLPAIAALAETEKEQVAEFAERWFAADEEGRKDLSFPNENLDVALYETAIKQVAWEAYAEAPLHKNLKEDFDAQRVRSQSHESPYTIKSLGECGPNGWPLFIAMHGGGGAAQEVNDSQWRHMQIYYRDQRQLKGYKYLALRAPNNTWNGFYDDYVYPLIHELIRQQVLLGEVDPNRVYLLGYSHGGYGAFAIGPKIPDHFAAIHSSAAAPTDGQSLPDTLRNTRFTYMIGAQDTSYGRAERCQKFAALLDQLRGDQPDIYPVTMEWQPDHGHSGLPDRDKIIDMYPFTRDPVPRRLRWKMSDGVVRDHFWLSCDSPEPGRLITADCRDNQLTIDLPEGTACFADLDTRLVDFSQPLMLTVRGVTQKIRLAPRVEDICASILSRGDVFRSSSCRLEIE